jgi:Kef-type K+ transport system membrane component KefB
VRAAAAAARYDAVIIVAGVFVVLIAVVALLAGRAARFAGQPAMIGYVAAGIAAAFALPRGGGFDAAMRACALLGELGVLALMFTSGAEMDGGELRSRARRGVPLTLAVILTPFACGLLLAPRFPQLRGAHASPTAFAIFMATCMAVTAFPVLIEILRDRGLLTAPIGVTAAGIAAVNDVVAWLLLAGVALWSAAATPPLLVVAVFLAFFAGLAMRRRNVEPLRRFVCAPLLPLFFAGIGMSVAAIRGELAVSAIFIAVAALAKIVPAMLVAKLRGEPWRYALALGALLSARGAMELIAAKLGLELGLLSPAGFSVLVSVAVATTLLTGPLLRIARYSPSFGSTTAAAVSSSDAAA